MDNQEKPTKICLVSVHPDVNSGYGCGTKTLIKMMIDLGYDVCVYCSYGLYSRVETIEVSGKEVKLYPSNINSSCTLSNIYSVKRIEEFDLIFSFLDIFTFDIRYMEDYWIALMMVDSDPFMSTNLNAYTCVNNVLYTSKWAKEVLDECDNNIKEMSLFPVPIDESEFYIEDKEESVAKFKKQLNITGNTNNIFSVNAANIGDGGIERKNFPELLKWWGSWVKDNPEDYLYLHTDVNGQLSKGINIKSLLDLYKVPIDNIRFAQPILYQFGLLDTEFLRMVYNASDIMLVPSHSEGFGMPYVEAALCGCIPVGNDYGTGKEVIDNCGGVTIDCRESYYIKGAQKSKSYAEDIDKAVREALTKAETPDHSFILNRNAKEYYSIDTNKEVLRDLLSGALVHKSKLTLTRDNDE